MAASVFHVVNAMLTKNEQFKFVSCTFQTSAKEYTYKTLLDVKAGDTVLVDTASGLQIVRVQKVLEVDEVDLSEYDYKWVVQVIDLSHFLAVKEMEQKLQQDVRNKIRNKIADSALAQLYDGEAGSEQVKRLVRL